MTRRSDLQFEHVFSCLHCKTPQTRVTKSKNAPRFCNQSCVNKWAYANGRPSRGDLNDHTKYNESRFHTYDCIWCKKTNKKRFGNVLPRFCNNSCAQKWSGKNRVNGTESQKIAAKERMQKRLKEKPETVFTNAISGWYKGLFFRSSYEYFYMKQLESEGIDIQNDVELEPDFRISYEFDGKVKNYFPDFLVKSRNEVVEIKNSFDLKNDVKVQLKAEAAKKVLSALGISYKILTEAQIIIPKSISRKEIEKDTCVFLIPKNMEEDRWDAMFQQQLQFMKLLQEKRNFPNFPLDLKKKENQKLLKEISHDCMHELFEAVHLLKNSKSHRLTEINDFDRMAFLEELADAAHFLIEIFILLGVSPKEAFFAFMKKGTINVARIEGGY